MAAAESADALVAAAGLLCAVGCAMVELDASLADALMRDFGLPLLLPMLQGQPGRQRLVLQVVRGRVRVRVRVRATVRVRARVKVS